MWFALMQSRPSVHRCQRQRQSGATRTSGGLCGSSRGLPTRPGGRAGRQPRPHHPPGDVQRGALAHRLACERGETLAAIAPVAGVPGGGPCAPTRPVSVLHFHGTDDAIEPYNGSASPPTRARGVPPGRRPLCATGAVLWQGRGGSLHRHGRRSHLAWGVPGAHARANVHRSPCLGHDAGLLRAPPAPPRGRTRGPRRRREASDRLRRAAGGDPRRRARPPGRIPRPRARAACRTGRRPPRGRGSRARRTARHRATTNSSSVLRAPSTSPTTAFARSLRTSTTVTLRVLQPVYAPSHAWTARESAGGGRRRRGALDALSPRDPLAVPREVGLDRVVQLVLTEQGLACARRSVGDVWCWHDNTSGALTVAEAARTPRVVTLRR